MIDTAVAGRVTRAELAQRARQAPTGALTRYGALAAGIGGVAFLWALVSDTERAWQAYHTNFVFWAVLGQALVVFAASQKLAKGHWSGLIIRFAEAAVAFQFVILVLFVGLFLGREHLFGWLKDAPRPYLGVWFTTPVFFARNGLILALLAWLSWRFVRRDMAPDIEELATGRPVDPDAQEKGLISREAAILALAFAFGYSLIGFDLVVSLYHKWMSNLYGAFYFMGGFLGALGTLAVLTLSLRRAMGLEGLVSPRQLHDLGKLIFGFTVFWAYLMWAQFLVIWYGNLPEETYFVWYRLWGPWRPVGVTVFILVFVAPFIGLLGVKPKRRPATLRTFALVSLTGLWLERYLEVVPSLSAGRGPAIGVPEIGVTLLYFGLFLLAFAWFAKRYPLLSPRLAADTLEREAH
ncbi:MAG TPA: hypothetical protein VLV16_10655 [Gemmatimonadales bacterium]|nr:hypothetical protein [Gemmatimonadales bacterium]